MWELTDCESDRERDFARARALEVIDAEIEGMSDNDNEDMPEMR